MDVKMYTSPIINVNIDIAYARIAGNKTPITNLTTPKEFTSNYTYLKEITTA